MAAAIRVLSDVGVPRSTLRAVAAEAGIPPGTVHYGHRHCAGANGAVHRLPTTAVARTGPARGRHLHGTVYKAIAVYNHPFWRERKGGELIVLDDPGSGVSETSPPDSPGHLCALIGGPAARQLDRLSADERRRAVLEACA
nr:FAD-dependent oxidoreductase [Mycolicibacterium farcinogenes]